MNQKGFTLIELLVAMAVGGLLLTGLVVSIYQVSWGTARSNNQVTGLTDINVAIMHIRKDLQTAQSTNLIDGNPVPQNSVNLTWIDYTGWATPETRTHSSSYSLSGTELRRTYDGTPSVVGRYISYVGFTQNSSVVTVVITATAPGAPQRNETLKLSVTLRSGVVP